MQRNTERFREMQRTAEKCSLMTLMTFIYIRVNTKAPDGGNNKQFFSHPQEERSNTSPCCHSPKPSPASQCLVPRHSHKPDFSNCDLIVLLKGNFIIALHGQWTSTILVTFTVIFFMVFPSAMSHLTGAKLGLFQPEAQRFTNLFRNPSFPQKLSWGLF